VDRPVERDLLVAQVDANRAFNHERSLQLAKNRMTFEKQLRETKKKQKAAAKRADRRRHKEELTTRPQAGVEQLDDVSREDNDPTP
jgi:hypothetical protein